MIKSKKKMFMIITSFVLIMLLTTVTYAFFNYTRTGVANRIQVGRIYFNSEQGNSINLTNVFPIDRNDLDNSEYVGETNIHITGDTTYSEGIEYLVSVVDVNNTVNYKSIPISVDVRFNSNENKTIGTSDKNYFINRGGITSLYKVLAGETINEGNKLVVGYIKPDATGVDGNINIKAFIDKDRIAISDTYPSSDLKYWYNTEASEEDINACITYMTNNYSGSLRSDETMEAFCRGTGELNYKTIETWIKYYFNVEDKNFLEEYHLISKYQNETTSDWVDGRVVLTTKEWNSLQQDGISFKVKVEANEGIWVSEQGNAINLLPCFDASENVKEVYFNNMNTETMHQRYDAATIKRNVTYNNEGEVLVWLEPDILDNTKYIMYVASDGKTFFTTGSSFFSSAGLYNVEKIEFNNIDTSRVTDMNNMFYRIENLINLDLTSFDTSNVLNMSEFIFLCTSLETVNMQNLDLRKVQNMGMMFYGNSQLVELDLSGVQTRDVTNMTSMFSYSNNLESINLDNFGGDNLSSIHLFDSSSKIKYISMKNFNFGTANLEQAFNRLNYLETIDLSGSNMSNVLSLDSTFIDCINLNSINFDNVDMSSVTTMNRIFDGCTSLETIDLSKCILRDIERMSYMFYDCSNLISVNMSTLGGDDLITVDYMFRNCSKLQEINMSEFNFGSASMYGLYRSLSDLETIVLTNANASNVTDMSYLFENDSSLVNVYLDGISTNGLLNISCMFLNCNNLETLDLSSLNTSSVTNSSSMFYECRNLTTIKVLNSWNMSNVTQSGYMFYNCTSLVGGNGTAYDNTKIDKTMAIIDTVDNPGYLTLKTV